MAILSYLESIFSEFRHGFTRRATYKWFVAILCGLMTRTDHLGVTSIIRAIGISGKKYESLLHFFRSTAYDISRLKQIWYGIICKSNFLFKHNGRNLILGDGTKTPKEGKYMPGVKKLFQESENTSKPEFIFGHMFGGIAVVIGRAKALFACPLDMTIQEGLRDTAEWNAEERNLASHIAQTIRNGYEAAAHIGLSYLVLDRYFLSVAGLIELSELNSKEHLLDIVTRAKDSCTAYYPLPPNYKQQRGRRRKKGASVKLKNLFSERSNDFVKTTVMMYGEEEEIEYLCLDLQWGKKLYTTLRFVLVKRGKSHAIFVSTDLDMSPESIIEAYAHRFKIESMFREFKQQIGGFGYHFWTKATPKLNRYKKKEDPNPLSTVSDKKLQKRILLAISATERFVFCSCVAMGITQMMALTPSIAQLAMRSRYLRTSSCEKVSEASIINYLRKNFFQLLLFKPDSGLSRIIRDLQYPYIEDLEDSNIA